MGKLRYYRFLYRYLRLVAFQRDTLGRTAEALAASRPDAPCCRFEEETISFAAMNRRANRRANFFHGLGVGKGEVVCLLMENRPEFLETVIGLAKLGAVTALLNTNLKGSALAHCINISGATRVIVGAECLEALQAVLPDLESVATAGVFVDTRWSGGVPPPAGTNDLNGMLAGADESNPHHPPLSSKDLVLYIYTSGTTGLPKAARINHYRLHGAGLAMGFYALALNSNDVVYCALPLYHSNGILIAFGSAMVSGAALALSRRFSASGFWDEAAGMGATAFIYIGEVLRYLVNQPPSPAERQHRVTRILGNGLRPDIWPAVGERFGIAHIREFYASTEGNAITINLDDRPESVGTCVLKLSDNLVVVRYDVEADDYIRDAQGHCQRCQPGEAGELLAENTRTVPFHGYANARETERKILRNVFKPGDAYFRTGDLVSRDAQGYYYFVDRIGDTYRWKGENVSAQEVQEILSGFDGLHMVNVYGVKLPGAEGRVGMAALQMGEGHAFDGAGFYRFATERLASYAAPAFVRLVSEMDLTGTYKLRKTDLQSQGFDPEQVEGALFYVDRDKSTYAPLDSKVYRDIIGGSLGF